MATFLFVGSSRMEFPAEKGVTPFSKSFTVEPGAAVVADVNPDPRWFDAVDGSNPPAQASQEGTE